MKRSRTPGTPEPDRLTSSAYKLGCLFVHKARLSAESAMVHAAKGMPAVLVVGKSQDNDPDVMVKVGAESFMYRHVSSSMRALLLGKLSGYNPMCAATEGTMLDVSMLTFTSMVACPIQLDPALGCMDVARTSARTT